MSRSLEIANRINVNRVKFHNNDVWEACRLLRVQDALLKQALELLGLIGSEDDLHHEDKIELIKALRRHLE